MSIISEILSVSNAVTRSLHGEAVTITDRQGIPKTIEDAIVTVETPSVGDYGSGQARWSGVLRLDEAHLVHCENSNVASVRGHDDWNIVAVGKPRGGMFRVEIRRGDQNHTNMTDLSNNQANWGDG